MSNYVDTIQLEGGTDYPIKVPNGVTYRNPSAMTPSQNPLLRRNDLVQNLSDDEDNPPSSKAVKTVTDGLNSQLTSDGETITNDYVSLTVYKAGVIKCLYLEKTLVALTQGQSYSCGSLPVGYRPTQRILQNITGNNREYQLDIYATGGISITPLSSMPGSAANIYASFPFA
jgi:hypothetical protein